MVEEGEEKRKNSLRCCIGRQDNRELPQDLAMHGLDWSKLSFGVTFLVLFKTN